MVNIKDLLYSIGFRIITVIFFAAVLLLTTYSVIDVDSPKYTILQHIFLSDKNKMMESILFSAPFVCNAISLNQWITIVFPLVSSMPFLMQFADEFNNGFYRMKLSRMSYCKYWTSSFLKNGSISSISLVTGYFIFVEVVYAFFFHIKDYPSEMQVQLNSPMNKLFHSSSDFIYLFNQALVLFVFTFLVSQFCMLIFLLLLNRYKAIGLPMIFFYLLDQISHILFIKYDFDGKYNIISPARVVFSTQSTFENLGMNYWSFYFWALILIAALYLVGLNIFKRRLMN